ncbi:YggT family protein [Jiangella ureilytica]|uniref:YggT family protein n=1 Tax=Jiangella ureilytica TaxID=2530374 RepID=A0A4R4RD09_9ACTN|nr:YggT family protein [Jiangella ureilytica]
MSAVSQILSAVLWLFFIALLIRLVVDWIQVFAREWQPKGLVLVVLEAIYTVTDPPLRAIRRVLPPLRIGSIALDLAFIVLIILVQILLVVVGSLG